MRKSRDQTYNLCTGPFTKYKIWLKAFTWKNEGQSSNPFEMVTDVAGPSAPIITNLTCKDESSIYLQWDRPQVVYKTIDYYYIYYMFDGKTQFREVAVGMNGTLSRGSKVSGTPWPFQREGGYWIITSSEANLY